MEYLITAGALAVMVVFAVFVRRAEATTRRFLPALDRTPRTATVLGVSPAPRGRFTSEREASERWMVEVEYVDGGGTVRRESLADLFDGPGVRAFTPGSQWQVYGFMKPRGRCLLTEEHDSLPRSGYNLDRLRIRAERCAFRARPGSPILGVMRFMNDDGIGASGVSGLAPRGPGTPRLRGQRHRTPRIDGTDPARCRRCGRPRRSAGTTRGCTAP